MDVQAGSKGDTAQESKSKAATNGGAATATRQRADGEAKPSTAKQDKSSEPPAPPAKSKAPLIIFLVLLAGGAWLAWHLFATRPQPIATLYGNVDIREVNLSFRVPGRISQVLFDEGDAIKAGEVVARLDDLPQRHMLNQAVAEVNVQQANLSNAHATLARIEKLMPGGGISRQAYDDAVNAVQQGAANLELAKAKTSFAQTQLDDTEMRAPTDGVVITRAQEPGAVVQPGVSVLSVSLEKPVWVRAYVEEPDLGLIAYGKEVEFTNDTRPDHVYHGKIGYISPRAEFTPKSVETTRLRTSLVYRIRIVVSDADSDLRQGMPITVHLQRDREQAIDAGKVKRDAVK